MAGMHRLFEEAGVTERPPPLPEDDSDEEDSGDWVLLPRQAAVLVTGSFGETATAGVCFLDSLRVPFCSASGLFSRFTVAGSAQSLSKTCLLFRFVVDIALLRATARNNRNGARWGEAQYLSLNLAGQRTLAPE